MTKNASTKKILKFIETIIIEERIPLTRIKKHLANNQIDFYTLIKNTKKEKKEIKEMKENEEKK